jgi:hypothetical protein
MSNKSHAGTDFDCATYGISARHKCLKDAVAACSLQVNLVQEYFPSLAQQRSPMAVAASHATQFFRFYQEYGQWAWQRVQEPDLVLETSSSTFTSYSRCAADARKHGWKGKPLRMFAIAARGNRNRRSPSSR